MSLLNIAGRIMRSLGVGGGKPEITRDQAFEALPVRNPDLKWRLNDQDCFEVVVPRRRDRVGRIMGFVFAVPESRPVVLDEVGTFIWHRCDGEHTVEDLVEALREEYKLGRREVELSLTEYLRMLGKRGMIGLLVPEDAEDGEEAEAADSGDEPGQAEEPAPADDEGADDEAGGAAEGD